MDAMRKLLIVDDDPDLLEMTARRLKRKGFDVITAQNLTEAASRYEQYKQDYVAVICDLFLGQENGLSFFEFLKGNGITIPFVLATGDDAGDKRIEPYRETEKNFMCLQKPFELQLLMEIIDRKS